MKKKVILVHGYFKTEKDMCVLKTNLEKNDFEVHTINLPLTFKTTQNTLPIFKKEFNQIADDLADGSDFEMAAIAGNNNKLFLAKLLSKENDGRIRVESVKFSGLKDFVVLPYGHKDIHYQEQTASLVANFLNYGSFSGHGRNEK